MKRLFLALLTLVVVLTGCAASPQTPVQDPQSMAAKLKENFSSTAQIQVKGVCCEAKLQRKTGYLQLCFTSPASLSGMEITLKGDSADVSYRGLSATFSPDALLNSAPVQALFQVLNATAEDLTVEAYSEEGYVVVKGKTNESAFTLKINNETGNFLSLTFPEEDISFTFDQFQFAY